MNKKKAGIIATGALASALLLSGVGYAYAETTDVASEQGFMGKAGGGLVAIVADLTGLDAGDVLDRRTDGESFTAIAESEGVSSDDVKDAAVEEFEAGLDDRLASTDELRGRMGRGGPGGMMGGPGGPGVSPEAVLADMSDLTNAEIHDARTEGQSLAQIAEGAGVDIDDVIAEVMASAAENLEAAVDEGRIDADKVDDILENMEERITEMVNSTDVGPMGGRGGRGGSGMAPEADAE